MNYTSFCFFLSIIMGFFAGGYVCSKLHKAFYDLEKIKTTDLGDAVDKGTELIAEKIKSLYTATEFIERIAVKHPPIEAIEHGLQEAMSKNNALISCGIVYAPYAYITDQELVSRRVVRQENNTLVTYAVNEKERYTDAEWYRRAQGGKPYISSPFLDDISNQMIVRYSYPFYIINTTDNSQQFGGVVTTALPLTALDAMVLEMSLDKSTYAMLVDSNGAILAHPTEIVTHEEKTIQNLARNPGNKNLLELYNHLIQAKDGNIEIKLGAEHNSFKTMYKKVPNTNWYLILMHLQNVNPIPTQEIFRLLVMLLLIVVGTITSIGGVFFFICCTPLRAAWLASSLYAFLVGASIGAIWAFDIISDIPDNQREHVIDTHYSLQRFLFIQKKENPHVFEKEPILIPTGIYITSFEPGHDGSLTLTGQVWQKYDRSKYPNLKPNILFLNAIDEITEKNSSTFKGSLETVNWWFKATFHTTFNYLKYPFDEQEIVITLCHKEYESNIILTPDFEAFLSNDSPRSEIDPEVHSNQWTIKQSYSFYTLSDFQTDFGIEDYPGQKGFPNLNYGIRIRRQFVYPLTASALPVVIILFVVFSILLLTGLNAHHTSLATEIVKLTSGILFTTAVAHQTFQRTLQSPAITYFEYFYFLLYAVILLIAINGMLYAYDRGGRFINTENNLIPRLLYWPLTLSLCLGLTLWFFY